MKTKLILLFLCLTTTFNYAQKIHEKDVPVFVLQAFQEEFPAAKVDRWEKVGDHYEVEFKVEKKENSVVYTSLGVWIEKEVEIKPNELPKFVLEYFEKNQAGRKIKEASKIISADGRITYKAEVEDTEYKFQEEVGLFQIEKEDEKEKEKN